MDFEHIPIQELLSLSTMTLATCGADGSAHAAPVYFVADQALHIYFFSESDSRHVQDIRANPHLAVAIYPECTDWQEIHGLQMHGEAHQVEHGSQWETAWELYQAKFPFVAALKALIARHELYVFRPRWIRLVDNRQGFGYKREWGFP